MQFHPNNTKSGSKNNTHSFSKSTHRDKVGACKVSDDPRGCADPHVTNEGQHPTGKGAPCRDNVRHLSVVTPSFQTLFQRFYKYMMYILAKRMQAKHSQRKYETVVSKASSIASLT